MPRRDVELEVDPNNATAPSRSTGGQEAHRTSALADKVIKMINTRLD